MRRGKETTMWWWADDDEAPEWVDKLRELMGRDEWEMAVSVATVMLPGKEGARERATLYGIRGVARSRMEEYDDAIADFTRALEIDGENARLYDERGVAFDEKGEHDLAVADLDKAVELQHDFVDGYYHRGEARANRGEFKLAISDFTRALKINDRDPAIYCARGFVRVETGANARVIADLTRALELAEEFGDDMSDWTGAYYQRAMAYQMTDKPELAVVDLDFVLNAEPDNFAAHFLRGEVYLDMKQYEPAIADFRQALKLDPDSSLCETYLHRALEQKQKKAGGNG